MIFFSTLKVIYATIYYYHLLVAGNPNSILQHLGVRRRVPWKNEALSNLSDIVKCQAQAQPHHHPVGHLLVDLLSHLVQMISKTHSHLFLEIL